MGRKTRPAEITPLKKVGIFVFGIFMLIFGSIGVQTVSPYKKCNIFSSGWPGCENQLKSSSEYLSDLAGPVLMLIFGVLIMLGFTVVIGKKVYDNYSSGSRAGAGARPGKSRRISRSKSPGVREVRYVEGLRDDEVDGDDDKNNEVENYKL